MANFLFRKPIVFKIYVILRVNFLLCTIFYFAHPKNCALYWSAVFTVTALLHKFKYSGLGRQMMGFRKWGLRPNQ